MSEMPSPDDEKIVAWLDGEAEAAASGELIERLETDAALRERLSRLSEGGVGLKPAFGLLMEQAPLSRLDAMLDGVLAVPPVAGGPVSGPRRPRFQLSRWLAVPAFAALAACLFGVWLGYAVLGSAPPEGNWRDAVAGYWALTTPDTLAIDPSADQAARQLALAAEKLGLPLTLAAVTVPDASFRGAMMLDYEGRPLTQIAYLDKGGGPFAYCVIKAPTAGESGPAAITMGEFNVIHWSGGGYARLLIGRMPAEALKRYADVLKGRAT
jgi:anti-sigma factor RsiW